MSRSWEELEPVEQEEYFHWVIMLMEQGKLEIMDQYELELKARSMYNCDRSVYNPDREDPFKGLNIDFDEY